MLHSIQKNVIVLGLHEFESDEWRGIAEKVANLEMRFCADEAEFSLELNRRHPDAVCLCAPWDGERAGAALHQVGASQERRVPVFLCGPAAELPIRANGALEIHRLDGAISGGLLAQALSLLQCGDGGRLDPEASDRLASPLPQPDFSGLARFVGGIAHDFNNLLAAIIGEVQLAASRTQDERVVQHLDRANEACFRMAGEIRKLLIFQEGAAEKRGMVEVGKILRDARRFLPELLGGKLAVETVECPEPLWVEGSVSGLRQILINLVAYAGHQVTDGRGIRVGLRRLQHSESPFPGRPYTAGRALIEVEVHGEQPMGALNSASFEPVFSRPVRDAGVSLAIVWKLVQDFDGSVSVLQDGVNGAVYRVTLPLAHPAPVKSEDLLHALSGDETILVVSTDRIGVESLVRNMRQLGYQVGTASSIASIALNYGEAAEYPACVLIDTDCEALDPVAAHTTVRSLSPRVPILLAAPELASLCRSPFSSDGLTCLVHKPLDLKEVLATVRALLATPGFAGVLAPQNG